MGPEPGPFAAFYASPLQHPGLLWLAAAAALAFSMTRRGLAPSARRYCLALVALSLADAWLTANHVIGLGALPAWAGQAVPLFFVLAGDLRFLFLLGAATAAGGVAPGARTALTAGALTLVVPLGSQLALLALPAAARAEPRVLFLVYEAAFFALTLALLRWHPGPRRAPWLVLVARFVLLYYGLWAAADAWILATGSDLGFLLRVVPNVLYYGGLVAVIAAAAAQAARKAATAAFQASGSSK